MKKTWIEKLQSGKMPKVKQIDINFADIPAGSKMFIATPEIIDNYIKQIPKGKSIGIKTLRNDLAINNQADYTCPVTTGIFLRIVAEANFEKYKQTKTLKGITPFWRIIEPHSPLSKKLSFGEDFLITQRQKEKLL